MSDSASTRVRVLTTVIVAAGFGVVAGSFAFMWPWSAQDQFLFVAAAAALVPAYVVPGTLIARRQPNNAVGWVLALVGLLFGLLVLSTAPGESADARGFDYWNSILTDGLWAPGIYTLLGVIPLIFPNGHLPSRRWRVVIWASVTGIVLTVVMLPFASIAAEPHVNRIANKTIDNLSVVGPILCNIAFVAAMVGMIRHYRRSRGVERDQMKLFVVGVVTATTLMVTNGLLIAIIGEDDIHPLIEAGLLLLAAMVLSVAIGVAILRHRLFDINVVISKAVVFGVLGIVITGLYVGIVVGIGALVGAGNEPNLGLSIAATAIAALAFQPLRVRARSLANRLVYGKRATPYEVLAHLSEELRETQAGDEILGRMAKILAQGTGASLSSVWIRRGAMLWRAASWPVETPRNEVALDDGAIPPFDADTFAVPVRHAGALLGALTVTKPPADPITATEQRLVEDLGAQAGLVLRNAGLTAELLARLEELKASRQRLVKAQDEERRRLERNLHDGAQQMLVAVKIKLGAASMMSHEDDVKALLGDLQKETGDALDTLRDLARGIYPPLLASHGLTEALRSQAGKATIPVEVRASGEARYAPEVEAAVYFCVLEALQNVQKYAGASTAVVSLELTVDRLAFTVSDDGAGFDPATTAPGSGTNNMRDRLAALDGSLEIDSAPGRGTRVTGTVPGS